MRVIFGILFAVIIGLIGARLAGPIGDWLLLQPTFESPDQAANFDLVVRVSITLAFAVLGTIVGVLLGGPMRRRLIRREG